MTRAGAIDLHKETKTQNVRFAPKRTPALRGGGGFAVIERFDMSRTIPTSAPTTASVSASPFPGHSEMAALMRGFDWPQVGLPPADEWPESLKAVTRILLTSRYAMWMGWGPDLTFMYNDSYGAMTLGKKHPWALGKPAREVWAEIWDDLEPRIRTVMETGEATWDEGLLLFLERSGFSEETYHTFSYSPVISADGNIAGMFCVVTEETERIIGERRLATLRDLAATLGTTVNGERRPRGDRTRARSERAATSRSSLDV